MKAYVIEKNDDFDGKPFFARIYPGKKETKIHWTDGIKPTARKWKYKESAEEFMLAEGIRCAQVKCIEVDFIHRPRLSPPRAKVIMPLTKLQESISTEKAIGKIRKQLHDDQQLTEDLAGAPASVTCQILGRIEGLSYALKCLEKKGG